MDVEEPEINLLSFPLPPKLVAVVRCKNEIEGELD